MRLRARSRDRRISAGVVLRSGLIRRTDSDPTVFDGYDGTRLQNVAVACQDPREALHLLSCGQGNETDDADVWSSPHHGQFTEILVEGHEDPMICEGQCENLIVSWIFGPLTRPDDVVAC